MSRATAPLQLLHRGQGKAVRAEHRPTPPLRPDRTDTSHGPKCGRPGHQNRGRPREDGCKPPSCRRKNQPHGAVTCATGEAEKFHRHTVPYSLGRALGNCGYQDWAIDKELAPDSSTSDNPVQQSSGNRVSVIIPYQGDLSEKLGRIYRDRGVATRSRPTNALRQSLVHPKDGQPELRVGGVVCGVLLGESGL